MNNLKIYNSDEFGEIRTVIVNDEPMFCLADICKALELSQPSKVKERLLEKGVRSIPRSIKRHNRTKCIATTSRDIYR